MKLLVVVALLLSAVAALPSKNVLPIREALRVPTKIISGKPAAEAQFPWQVWNEYKNPNGTFCCGGALVATRWVLTAGHCAYGAYEFKITLGSLRSDGNLEDHAQVIVTDKAVVHPEYNRFLNLNDIALINLKVEPVLSKYIGIIQTGADFVIAGRHLTVSGWGRTSDYSTTFATTLNYVELLTISNLECKKFYLAPINDGSICCVGAPEHSTCFGDSGGALVLYDGDSVYHVGVATFVNRRGCSSGRPSGYTRTSFYRPWILKTIADN